MASLQGPIQEDHIHRDSIQGRAGALKHMLAKFPYISHEKELPLFDQRHRLSGLCSRG